MSRVVAFVASIALAPAFPAAGGVLVVDQVGGAGVFTSFVNALGAAADGDTILVHAGDYSGEALFGASTQGKALTIVADPPGAIVELGPFGVSGLAAHQTVVLRGLRISGAQALNSVGLIVKNCAGSVWVEDSTLTGGRSGPGPHLPIPGYAALETNAAHVTLVRCSVRGGLPYGGDPINGPGSGGCGIVATNATVAVFDSVVAGESPAIPQLPSLPSGVGIVATGSSLAVSGSSVTGGAANCGTCLPGFALQANAASSVRWIDSTFAKGGGGLGGSDISAPAGVVSSWPGSARSLRLTSPVVELQPVTVDVEGVAGDTVWIVMSANAAHVPLAIPGWLAVAPPVVGPFLLAAIPAPATTLTFNVVAPPLVPATIDAFTFLVQPLVVNGAEAFAGAPSAFTLVR